MAISGSSSRSSRIRTTSCCSAGVFARADLPAMRTSFNASGSVMAFNEGQRNIGLMLQAEVLEASPEAYMTMLNEQRKK